MKVLFGYQPDWSASLRRTATNLGYDAHMAELPQSDLSTYDAVVPLSLCDRADLARRIARGEAVPAIIPSAEAEALCHDKLAFNQAMVRAGLGDCIPPMHTDWPTAPEAYPLILKARRDQWGLLSRIIFAPPDPGDAATDQTFLQTYVPGSEEWATHLLLCDGEILFEASICYTLPDTPHVKGKYVRPLSRKWKGPCRHLDLFRRVLEAVGFRDGTCCIDYRMQGERVHIFEVNPRFGGSLSGNAGPYLNAYCGAVGLRRGRTANSQARAVTARLPFTNPATP